MHISLIDLGTNSARLFIFKIGKSGKISQILKKREMIRLGDGLFHTKKITPEAKQKALKAFENFKEIILQYDAKHVRSVGTSALREAKNSDEFIKDVHAKTGILIEVISGTEEARLISDGVLRDMTFKETPVLFIDIGGGSTEISCYHNNKIQETVSLNVGSARCQQLYLQSVPPIKNQDSIRELEAHIAEQLRICCDTFPKENIALAVGTSGAIRALHRIHHSGEKKTQEFPVSFIKGFINRIQTLEKAQILEIPLIEEKRADLILAATIILDQIITFFNAQKIMAVKSSLKDGLLHDYIRSTTSTEVTEKSFLKPE